MDQNTVNVEEIMQEIREKLNETWGDIPPFESVPVHSPSGVPADYAGEVNAMNNTWNLAYVWPLSPNPIKRFVQRVIKRMMKFLLIQLIWQQNEFNAHTVRAMNWTKNGIDTLTAQIISLEQELEELRTHMEELENQNDSLRTALSQAGFSQQTIPRDK